MKLNADIPPINGRTPVPPVMVNYSLGIVLVKGRRVTASIRKSATSKKCSNPAGAIGAYVYTFVGVTYPGDPSTWTFNGAATKSLYEIVFPQKRGQQNAGLGLRDVGELSQRARVGKCAAEHEYSGRGRGFGDGREDRCVMVCSNARPREVKLARSLSEAAR